MTFLLLPSATVYCQVPAGKWTGNDISDKNGNTGMGNFALGGGPINSGTNDTAAGFAALSANSSGSNNTAVGQFALSSSVSTDNNTAIGAQALGANDIYNAGTAIDNTAVGYFALQNNEFTAPYNTALGAYAPWNNDGEANTAVGTGALQNNSVGVYNTGSGTNALYKNTSGNNNTALGFAALLYNAQGSNNIAVGYEAGYNVTTGGNNFEIGNNGAAGAAGDANLIRIGTEGVQDKTFIAGIYNTSVTGSAVMVDSSGQLGVVVSSERFKTAIATMGENTEKLAQLRPVTFKLKNDDKGIVQYGLIAEEVAKVYPELVVHDGQGRIDGVRYDELAPMLLNEMQRQSAKIAAEHAAVATLVAQHAANEAKIRTLERQLTEIRAALIVQPNKDQLVARR